MIPTLRSLRRVPDQYRTLLPIIFMKRYQCLIVGVEQDALTVAIATSDKMEVCHLLHRLTGYKVFPVLVDPMQISLQLRRMERRLSSRQIIYRNLSLLSPYAIISLMTTEKAILHIEQ